MAIDGDTKTSYMGVSKGEKENWSIDL